MSLSSMHRLNFLLCVATGILWSTGAICAEPDKDKNRNPWYGFPEGAWVIRSETATRGDERREKIEKFIKFDDSETFDVKVLPQTSGEFDESKASRRMHILGGVPAQMKGIEEKSSEKRTLSIGGREYECTVKKYGFTEPRDDLTIQYVLWYHNGSAIPYRELATFGPDLAMPPDVLKAEFTMKSSKRSETLMWQVIDLEEELRIGDRSVKCVVEEGKFSGEREGKMGHGTSRRWLSDEVPGRVVKEVANGEFDGMKATRLIEVKSFHVPDSQ